MHRDNADALNRTLDSLANGDPVTGGDLDRDLLATVRWLDEIRRRDAPDPDFVARLEHTLLNDARPDPPAAAGARSDAPRRTLARSWNIHAIQNRWRLPRWRWASGALAWGAWALLIALLGVVLIGALQFLPDRTTSDPPAIAPGFPLETEAPPDLATHPIVGAWRLETESGTLAYAVFHADGTYVEVNPLQGTGVGVWRPAGERSGELVVQWPNRNESGRLEAANGANTGGIGASAGREIEYLEGWSTLRSTFEVSEDRANLTGTYRLEQFLPDEARPAVEVEGDVAGTRISIEPSGTDDVDPASHPIVGVWTLQPEQGPPSVVAFHADGTYLEVSSLQGTGVGVWLATDERSGTVLVEWPNRNEAGRRDAATLVEGYLEGWATLESTFTIGADGVSFAGTSTMQRYYPNGIEFHGEEHVDLTCTRLVHESTAAADVAPATHPIVGAWMPDTVRPDQGPRSCEIFHPDGTHLITTSCCHTGLGVWQPTAERSAEVVVHFMNRNNPMGVPAEGTTVLRKDVTLADDDDVFSGSLRAEYYFPNGIQMVDEPSGPVQGTRFTFDAVATPGPSPVAATPEG